MKAKPLAISGAFEIQSDPVRDERGAFARIFCEQDFVALGFPNRFVQTSISQNLKRWTLRGLHYQTAPFAETKLIGCVNGKVFDVVVDLRSQSSSFGNWTAVELSAERMNFVLLPEGCAHGFLSLDDNSVLYYAMTSAFSPTHSAGIIWNDPKLAIQWPSTGDKIISAKDRSLPGFDPKKRYFEECLSNPRS